MRVILLLFLAVAVDSAAETELDAAIDRTQPAVVGIQAYMRSPAGSEEFTPYAMTTGFFFDATGFIFTTYSPFVDPEPRLLCERFEVTAADGQVLEAEAWNAFPLVNLAILKVPGDADYPEIQLSGRPVMKPDDEVAAVAAARPGEDGVYRGVVLARGSNSLYGKGLADLLSDIAMEVPPRVYGAPLVNQKGEVVGMCLPPPAAMPDTVPPSDPEVHALPVLIITTMQKMKMVYPPFEQPWLGIETRRAGNAGLMVDFVWDRGPAAAAGFRVGDILRHPRGARMADTHDLDLLLRQVGPGAVLNLRIVRDGQEMTKAIAVETRARWAAPWVEIKADP